MAIYTQKSTGATFSEPAYKTRVENGANPNDFTVAGSAVEAAAHTAAQTSTARPLSHDEPAIYLPTGVLLSAGARNGWIASGRAKPEDFAPVPNTAAPVNTPAAPDATPAQAQASAAAPSGAVVLGYTGPGGLALSPGAAANYIARGLCKSEDLVPVYATGAGIGASSAAAAAAPASSGGVLPLSADDYTRAQLETIAEALALDASGNKAALVSAINTLGDEAGTAAAIAKL